MAASKKNLAITDKVKESQVPTPWCHEFEKMISGMNFHAPNAPIMLDHKLKVVKLLHAFNIPTISEESTFQSLKTDRLKIAKQIFGSMGTGVSIENPFFCVWIVISLLAIMCTSTAIPSVSIHDNAPVHIGNNVLIGPGACVCTPTHEIDAVERAKGGSHAFPIVIEDDCWIGASTTILPGVRIGRGSVVAAGAVVSKDIEREVLVGGVPAKVLKRLGE